MKRVIYFLASFSVAFTLIAAVYAQKGDILGKGENRLHNGGFENPVIDPWKLEVRADKGAVAIVEIDKNTSEEGKQSVKVTVTKPTGTAWHVKLRQDDRCFEKNKKFTLVFWAKAEKPRSIEASFQLQRDPWRVFFSQKIDIDTEWKEYNVSFTPDVDNFQDHWVAFHLANSDIVTWFDDVRYFQGDLKDEVGRERQQVHPTGTLSATWGRIKRWFY
ncbi:TPA: hypothetical protein EYP66_03315 [Candidatus Poribacteria bacterium]|nr:hypothetical protein [Candidatus Poribacteria bacterium]